MTENNESTRGLRVSRLRNKIIDAPREVCIERAAFLTQSMSQNWDKPPLTRMSLALEHVLENISVIIRDDEIIVGCRTSKLKGAPLFPENKSRWIGIDLDSFNDRMLQHVSLSSVNQLRLKEEVLPFWTGKTVEDRMEELLPPDVAEDMDKYIFTMILEITYGIGHFTQNYEKILKTGFSGLIKEAQEESAALPVESSSGEKWLFYDAMIRSLKAAIKFANRYADLADEMALSEENPERAEELRRIAYACRRVPEHPAQTFHEAVQSVYFAHLITQIESGGNSVSLGRIDQYLYPYYKADLEAGRITPHEARTLLSLLYIKANEIWNVLEEAFIPGGEGPEGKTTQNLTVGGVGIDGKNAVNDLSYIALDAYADITTVQPNFSVRISPDTPEDFFIKAVEYARQGVALHLFNDTLVIKSLSQAGHTIEDARNYALVGCVEPNAQGKTFGSTFAVQFNGAKCVEFALSNGIDNIFGSQAGLQTGNPEDFSTFDDVWKAYSEQVSHFMNQMAKGMNALDTAIAELVPSPFASAMIEGPMDSGTDLTQGGAVYNSTGVQLIGFANVADSLYAVKKAIFEDKKATIAELSEWLSTDWDDAEDRRAFFLNKISKYGNDVDDVDAMAADVVKHFCEEAGRHRTYRGGNFWPGVFSVGFHIAMGSFTGASADGRQSGDVLGNGATPTNGNALTGPTAVMNSVSKLPLEMVFNGANLNMRFNPRQIKTESLLALMKAYFLRGGYQIQFNMTDTQTLKKAQKNPDEYRDLVVRVSGYSALFVGLSEMAQNEIISRTEYETA